jgi:hypothetical protein
MKIGETMALQSESDHLAQALQVPPQKVNQIEVTCELMQADFSCVSFYTLE